MHQRSTAKPAFTLVELLVVSTIIATLAALLLPALGTAKDRAQASACASNLKQTGTGFATFLGDHNGFFPYISSECIPVAKPGVAPCTGAGGLGTNGINACASYVGPPCNDGLPQYLVSDGNWNPSCPNDLPWWSWDFPNSACCANHWVWQLAPYFGVYCKSSTNYAKALRCPANPYPWPATMEANYTAICTYRMNGAMFPASYRSGYGGGSAAVPGSPQGWQKMVNLSDIDHPGSVMLLGEAAHYPAPSYWTATSAYANSPAIAPCYVTNCAFGTFCDNHYQQSQNAYDELQVTPSKSYNCLMAYWHNNGMNALKVDGHVELIPKATLKTYAAQAALANAPPGNLFWDDGKGGGCLSAWYNNQYPGGTWPYNQ